METSYYERLSAQDSSFVRFDAGRGQLTIGAVAVFEPPASSCGPIDIQRFRSYVESRLYLLPRYRQRLHETPFQGHPIWVDDERFDLTHHVRSCALSRPGGGEQLKALAGSIASRPLDLERPLWELWLVEGLDDGGHAVIAKVHHCLMDGVTGVGVLQVLLSADAHPTDRFEEARHWLPRKRPDLFHFLSDGLIQTASLSTDVVRNVVSALTRPVETAAEAMALARSSLRTLATGLEPPPDTPLNQPIGRQRRIEWRQFDLGAIKDVKERLDGTVNDVILAVVAGAARHFFAQRSLSVADLDLRVIVPVDTRIGASSETSANQVSSWFLDLPVSEENPLERFHRVKEQTRQRKDSRAETSIDQFLRFADWSGSSRLPFWGVRLIQVLQPYNLIVTNVQGPKVPLYLLGTRLSGIYPTVPLFEGQGLTVAVMSYTNRIHYGLQADWDLVPDLAQFADGLTAALEELFAVSEASSVSVSAHDQRPERVRNRRPKPAARIPAARLDSPKTLPRKPAAAGDATRWRSVQLRPQDRKDRDRHEAQSLLLDLLLGDPPSSPDEAPETLERNAEKHEARIRAKGRRGPKGPGPAGRARPQTPRSA